MAECYLLYGENSVDLDERVADITQRLDPDGFGTTTLDLGETTLDEVANAVQANPFFGGVRVVVLRNVATRRQSTGGSQRGLDWSAVQDLLSAIPETTAVLVPVHASLTTRSLPVKFATASGWTVEQYKALRGRDLVDWVIQRVQRSGGQTDQEAARRLLSRLFPIVWERESRYESRSVNMQMLATEIDKLVTAAADGQVEAQMVEELVQDRSGVTAFKLNDATFAGRVDQSLQELDQVLASGDAPERVLAQLAREVSVLTAARCVDGYSAQEVANAAELSSGQVSMTVGRKSGWRKPEALQASMEAIRRAEWLVKTGRSQRTDSVIVPLTTEIAIRFRK